MYHHTRSENMIDKIWYYTYICYEYIPKRKETYNVAGLTHCLFADGRIRNDLEIWYKPKKEVKE